MTRGVKPGQERVIPQGSAYCYRCKTIKLKTAFGLNKSKASGVQQYCKECNKAHMKERRQVGTQGQAVAQKRTLEAFRPVPPIPSGARMLAAAGVTINPAAIISVDTRSRAGRCLVVTSGMAVQLPTRDCPQPFVESLTYDFSLDEAAAILAYFTGAPMVPAPDPGLLDGYRRRVDDLIALVALGLDRHKEQLGVARGISCGSASAGQTSAWWQPPAHARGVCRRVRHWRISRNERSH